ncbi:arylesterase [Croceiramulus getboli]|nr:arylesterase [Flavobacteriaceae bacterium YJPT1-3]
MTDTHSLSRTKLLKFCYFLGFLILLGCQGESASAKAKTQETPAEENEAQEAQEITTKTILFFGDSITAGYGLDDTQDSYPEVIQEKIDSLGWDYEVINSGVSGETTAGGLGRINWILNQDIDVFVLELGGNDGLRGVPLTETKANLQAIINAVAEKDGDIEIILAGMELPPNMGKAYTDEFRELFSELAQENDLTFIPFILKDVGGIPTLNQPDGIHPTVEGHEIVAETVWDYLKPLLQDNATRRL